MVKYSCEKCGKEFGQKGHYSAHINRKNPCVIESRVNLLPKENELYRYQAIDLTKYTTYLKNVRDEASRSQGLEPRSQQREWNQRMP